MVGQNHHHLVKLTGVSSQGKGMAKKKKMPPEEKLLPDETHVR